jgi:histidine kinase
MAFGVWLVPRTIGVHAGLVQRNAALTSRVTRLAETRGTAVDSAASELRRLERDLHDGAQARLVALGINLRAAEHLFKTNPDAALALVAESRVSSALALAKLRALVRGIHPPLLADRGLADAVRALALGSPVPAEADIQLPGDPPAPVESAVYFAVAEVLANAVKHSGADHVHIRIAYQAGICASRSPTTATAAPIPRRAVADLAAAGISAGPSGAASLAGARAALTGPGSASRRAVLAAAGEPVVVLLSTEAGDVPGR